MIHKAEKLPFARYAKVIRFGSTSCFRQQAIFIEQQKSDFLIFLQTVCLYSRVRRHVSHSSVRKSSEMLCLAKYFFVLVATLTISAYKLQQLPDFHQNELDISSRIVHGIDAEKNQFPYFGLAILYLNVSSTWCGCSLISSSWTISAAHCMSRVIGIQVLLGSTDRHNMEVSRNALRFIIHESYDRPTPLVNDIALIELAVPVTFSDSIQAINLPSSSDRLQKFDSALLSAAGLGQTHAGTPQFLQYTYLRGMSNRACSEAHWVFRDSMLCARSATKSGSGICFGDSGGPLISNSSGIPTLVGVSSFVQTQDCVNDVQGFTRVDRYLDWITHHTRIPIRL